MSEEDVLYEVTELCHWKSDTELLDAQKSDSSRNFLQRLDIRKLLPQKNKDLSTYYSSQLSWHFAVSNQDRTLIAVLQDNFLEIRHKRDDYQMPLGLTSVPRDEHPQWRKLTWSFDGIYVAFSTSNGELRAYNSLATLVCSIPEIENFHDLSLVRPNGAISALFLLEVRTKSAEWPYELIAIDFCGHLRSYFVSSTHGYKPYHMFSFGESSLTSATYISTFNILIIAFPTTSLLQKSTDDTFGLSSWRLLIEYPYYRLVKPESKDLFSKKEKPWSAFFPSKSGTLVLKMTLSLNVKFLSCLHSCGAISIWNLPQLTLFKIWQMQDLPQYILTNTERNSQQLENEMRIPSDISWCLDMKLVLLRNDGTLTVSNKDSLDNLLASINPKCHVIDRHPEHFTPPARLANVCDMNIGFLVLNHEYKQFSSWRKESESSECDEDDVSMSNAVDVIDTSSIVRQVLRFFIHFEIFPQRKKLMYIRKTYKLTAVKSVTPLELYEQKINNEEYSEALDFAKLFNLDDNRVYKKQWNNSCPVTTDSINEYLLKISDKAWIIHECCERIPETLEAVETLLQKGLELTDFSEFILDDQLSEYEDDKIYELKDKHKFEFKVDETASHFSQNQLHILELRKHLLFYMDALTVYKKIIDLNHSKYDEEIYKKFRSQSPFFLTLGFARDGNAEAVCVLFTYFGEEILPHWFEVLDNFPECVSPSIYKKLLPKFNELNKFKLWPCKRIRPLEWSESGDFKDLIVPKSFTENTASGTSAFSKRTVTEWYEKKIRQIVDKSGLIDYALELLNLASRNNISGLENLRHNLLIMDKLIYDLFAEHELSLKEIENYSDFEKLELLMSNIVTKEAFWNAISQILLPFLNRCETLISNSKDLILDTYLKQLSENDLMLPLTFFEYLSDKDKDHLLINAKKKLELRLLSVYSCSRVDQIELALKIIEVEPEFSDNNNSGLEEILNLRSRLTELHYELVNMQIFKTYGVHKTVDFLHNNKTNEQFQREVFTVMMNEKINGGSSSQQEIYALYDDMTFIQENLFDTLPRKNYLHIFAYSLLTCGRMDYIEEYSSLVLSTSSRKKGQRKNILSFKETVPIITEAAQYYYNIASSYDDPNISLAKLCLSLLSFHPDLEREKKLIDALQKLNGFGVHISPLKVRMCVDKKRILEKVLKSKPKVYKNTEQLVSLATDLEADEKRREDIEIEVLNLAVDEAFQVQDYSWCSSVITKLMENGKTCWDLCKKLCQCKEYQDLDSKQKLIKYALVHCPDNELIFLVEIRNDVERSVLRRKLQNSLQQLKSAVNEKAVNVTGDNITSGFKIESTSRVNEKKSDSVQGLISAPALKDLLHSSSTVLNVNFWKNTFKLHVGEDTDEVQFIKNTECKKLSFPEFYANLHNHDDCICFSSGTLKKEMKIFYLMLRYYLMSSKNDDDAFNLSVTDINDVITHSAISLFSNDSLLCLHYLLLFKDLGNSESVFSSLPSTAIVEKFALYFYCLKIVIESNVSIHDLVTEKPISALISRGLEEAEKGDSVCVILINKYRKALEKRRGANKLEDLGCGIDSERFFSDETYKLDSVLGLAMYDEREMLDTALLLGIKYDVSAEDIMLSHIKSLFLTADLMLLTDRLKEPLVINTLKQNPSYIAQKLITDIYDGLPGCDYQRLLLYYALMNQIAENEVCHHLKPKEHMKLLRKLKSFANTIDYKLLMADQPQIVAALVPAAVSGETKQLIRFVMSLPPSLKDITNMECIFEQLALKVFFSGKADISITERFEMSFVFLESISQDRATQVMQQILFSKYSTENMNTTTRQDILNIAINYFLTKSNGEENDLIRNLLNYSRKLTKIDEFNDICSTLDISEIYLRDLQAAIINEDPPKMKEIIIKMVLDFSLSIDAIKVVMEFARAGVLTDLITDLLDTCFEKKLTDVLLHRIENCLEDNEYEKCWCIRLESLRTQESISESIKKRIDELLLILQQTDEEIYNIIELLHETRLILREWVDVPSHISLFDVAKEETRLDLIRRLLNKSNSLNHFSFVLKVLKLWPHFLKSSNWKEDPWMLLLEKILALDDNETPCFSVLTLVQRIMNDAQPNKEMKRDFFECMCRVPYNRILLVWFCVLTNDDLLIQSVSGYIEDLREIRRLPKIIDENLRKYHS